MASGRYWAAARLINNLGLPNKLIVSWQSNPRVIGDVVTKNAQSDDDKYIPVYVDFTPTYVDHPATKDIATTFHREWLESRLEDILSRQSKLPILMLQNTDDSVKVVLDLLLEARTLFCHGHFYSCVAMCGIAVERIVKDVIRQGVVTVVDSTITRPTNKAFDQLERVEVRSLINFAAESQLLSNDVKNAASKVGDLRNKYAHARGQNPESDALRAVECLHVVVDGTVSVLKDYEIQNGRLVPRVPPEKDAS